MQTKVNIKKKNNKASFIKLNNLTIYIYLKNHKTSKNIYKQTSKAKQSVLFTTARKTDQEVNRTCEESG